MTKFLRALVVSGLLLLAAHDRACAEMRALLIGVSGYKNLPSNRQLTGPRNDVQLMKAVLEQRGFAKEQIVVLADGVPGAHEPTRVRILKALDDMAAAARDGDTVLLYFAGHGSQQPVVAGSPQAAQEPDGLHEIFLPIDVGSWDAQLGGIRNAIVDHEVRLAADRIQDRGAFVWAIFDTCHSATMVRGLDDAVRYRTVQPETLGVPKKALQAAEAGAHAGQGKAAGKGAAPAGKGRPGGSAYFYAAQTTEQTPEMPLPVGAPDRQVYGLFGFMLSRALELGQPMTYRQMGQYVLAQYAGISEARTTPLFSGTALDQPVLGQTTLSVRQWPLGRDRMEVAVGALAGIGKDAVFAVVPSPVAKEGDVVGYLQATDVRLNAAALAPVALRGKPALAPQDLKPGTYLRLVSSPERFDLRVAVDADDCGKSDCVWQPVLERIRKGAAVAGANIEWVTAGADVTLKLRRGRVQVLSPSEVFNCRPGAARALCSPDRIGTTLLTASGDGIGIDPSRTEEALRASLHSMARATNLLRLGARLSARMPSETMPVSVQRSSKAEPGVQRITAERVANLRAGDKLAVTLDNRGALARDVTVLYADSHYGIQVIFPRGDGESNRLEANAVKTVEIGIDDSTSGVERLLVIAVDAEKFGERADFSFLEQPALKAAEVGTLRARAGRISDDVQAFMDAAFADYHMRGRSPSMPSKRAGMQIFTFNVQ